MSDSKPENVRRTVEKAYARAISKKPSSCCSSSCCTPASAPAAEQIGYSSEELDAVPVEAATSSFGCGNPLAFADVKPGQTVVDLGSGAGLDLLLAARVVGPAGKVIGIDMTDAMIATARSNVARAGAANVEIRKGLIEDLPVDDASADWVISNCVINLSPEKERVFAEIQRVLKPGGTMQVSDIVAQDLPEWVRASQSLLTSCVAGAITEEEYLEGLRRAGLVDVEVTERVVYSASEIRGFLLEGELVATAAAEGLDLSPAEAERIAEVLAGKVWSAKIRARKG